MPRSHVCGEEVWLHSFFTSVVERGDSQLQVLAVLLQRELSGPQSRSGRFRENRNPSAGTQTLHRPAHRLAWTLRDKSTVLHKCTEMDADRNNIVLKEKTKSDAICRLIPSCWKVECLYRSDRPHDPPVILLRPRHCPYSSFRKCPAAMSMILATQHIFHNTLTLKGPN